MRHSNSSSRSGRGLGRGLELGLGLNMKLGMRTALGISVALLAAAVLASPAWADDDDEPSAFEEYLSDTKNTFLTGLNGVYTMPADPVMSTIEPLEEYRDLPGSVVTSHAFGLFQGTIMGLYRASMGVLDMVFAPLPFVTLSPEPRYVGVPGFEYEE